MYVEIHNSGRIGRVMNYHDQKMQQGVAECIGGANFIQDPLRLSKADALYHFHRLQDQNTTARNKTLHICVSFHMGAEVSNDAMRTIGDAYMMRMGIGDQPYLLYRHNDTHVPHFHIVASRVREEGKLIYLNHREYYRSGQIRHELEQEHGLVPPGRRLDEAQRQDFVKRVDLEAGALGPQLAKVIEYVKGHYAFGSIDEFNVVLRSYNMEAKVTQPELCEGRGLYYQVIDEGRANEARRIKASRLPGRPTMDRLEECFAQHLQAPDRAAQLLRVRVEVLRAFARGDTDWDGFEQRLKREQIGLSIQGDRGTGEGRLFFVDHRNQSVFDATALGEGYDIASLRRRCVDTEALQQAPKQEHTHRIHHQLV